LDHPPPTLHPARPTWQKVDVLDLYDIERTLRLDEGVMRLEGGRTDINLRSRVGSVLLFLFAVNTLGALSVIFLNGAGLLVLSDKVLIAVLAATVVQAATMLFTVVRYLFRLQ
jgi:hypothetical protein